MKTSILNATIGLSFLWILGCNSKGDTLKAEIPKGKIPVRTEAIVQQAADLVIQATGKFTTDEETMLSFKTGGIVSHIYVREGDKIRKGQLLATLDLTEINVGVNQAQLGYEKAMRDYERVQRLLADSVATLEQAQNAKTALDIAAQSLEAAKFNLSFSQIRAVGNGYVLKKFANPGQQVSAGSPVLQTNGIAQNNWKLKANLSDKDWAMTREGDAVEIFTGVENTKSYSGRISRKSQIADPVTGTYAVEIEFAESAPSYLASGMFGTTKIQSKANASTWYIPFEALLDANGGEGFVFVTKDGETATKVPVRVGKILPDKVQIIDGLEGYSDLIVTGSAYLTNQSPIQITK